MSLGDTMSSHDRATERTPLLASVAVNEAQETQLSGVLNVKSKSPGRQIALDLLRGLLMVAMAIDHSSLTFNAYNHGTGIDSEEASHVITHWNSNLAYILRTFSHLCAPGFTMLLGVGIAFFTESRLAQGTSPMQFIKHFSLRALGIVAVSIVSFIVIIIKPPHLYVNAILAALAIDYALVGFLYVFIIFAVQPSLIKLVKMVMTFRSNNNNNNNNNNNSSTPTSASQTQTESSAKAIASQIINGTLFLASVLFLWGNIWTSPNKGACLPAASIESGWDTIDEHCVINRHFPFYLFFRSLSCPNFHFVSGFPPFGWIAFAFFGLLYGRILIHGRFKTTSKVIVFNITLSLVLALLFISTRLLSYGNLSTNCLATPDQLHHHRHPSSSSSSNQYLDSFKSFFYIAKYPPSPAFAFFTLSICYMLIAAFTAISITFQSFNSRFNPLLVYGTQPLFFYGFHLLFLQIMSPLVLNSRFAHPMPKGTGRPGVSTGLGLTWTFGVAYLLVMIVMYIACWQYSKFKIHRGRDSLWRFL